MKFVNNESPEKFGVKFKLVSFTILTTDSGYDTTAVSDVAKLLPPSQGTPSTPPNFTILVL